MILLGTAVGLLYGVLSGFILLVGLFGLPIVPPVILTILGPLTGSLSSVGGLLAALPGWLAFVLWYLLNVIIFWLACIPGQAAMVAPTPPTMTVATNPAQMAFRGLGIGSAVALNTTLLLPFISNPVIGILIFLSALPLLALIPALRLSLPFQGIAGWACWFLPIYWFANAIGAILFFASLPFSLAMLGRGSARLDLTSGAIEIRVPVPFTAFNLGTFTFLSGVNPTIVRGPFLGPNVSSHEVGHHINTAVMTPFYTFGTVIEEFRLFGGPVIASIGQQTAESRGAPRPGIIYSPIWSP